MANGKEIATGTSTKKPRLNFTDCIEVVVGEDKQAFTVPKNIISARSPFFEAACSERWASPTPKPMMLPADSAEIFDIYLHCVYHNSVDVGDVVQPLPDEHELGQPDRVYIRLVQTYLLADKLGDAFTANMVIDELIRFSNAERRIPNLCVTALVASNTMSGSPLRCLLIDYFVHEADLACISPDLAHESIDKTFVVDVLREKTRIASDHPNKKIREVFRTDFTSRNKCRYDQHNDKYPRCGDYCENKSARNTAT